MAITIKFTGPRADHPMTLPVDSLVGADLAGLDLKWGQFREMDMRGADLSGADLRHTVFWGANVTGATLDGARLNFHQGELTAELLRQTATTPAQLELAALRLEHRNLNHELFEALGHPEHPWAMDVLRKRVGAGDDVHPSLTPSLVGADLSGDDFRDCAFSGQDLRGADFRRSDLRWAVFKGANLREAKFSGARLNFCSHDLLAEILRQAAVADGDPKRMEAVETVLSHPTWGWGDFFKFNGPHEAWCFEVLKPFVQSRDDGLPERPEGRQSACRR